MLGMTLIISVFAFADKFSRHVIVCIPKAAFKDNSHAGAFVSEVSLFSTLARYKFWIRMVFFLLFRFSKIMNDSILITFMKILFLAGKGKVYCSYAMLYDIYFV